MRHAGFGKAVSDTIWSTAFLLTEIVSISAVVKVIISTIKNEGKTMLSELVHVNWIAVLVATLASSALGGPWFGLIMAKPYAASLGRTYDPSHKPGPLFIVGPLVCALIINLTSAAFIGALNLQTFGAAAVFGLIVGVGYLTATLTNIAINPNMPHPFRYAAINAPYFILSSIIAALIIVAFG